MIRGRSTSPAGAPVGTTVEPSLANLLHTERYEATVFYDDESRLIGSTGYPEYPVRSIENDEYWVCLEGRVYDRSSEAVRSNLLGLAASAFDDDLNRVTDWLLDRDGDFLVTAVEQSTGDVAFLNDALGRLPTYYRVDDDHLTVSREVRFIAEHVDSPTIDREAVAQYLLLGYPLGDRTLLEGVSRLPPATLLRANPDSGDVRMDRLHRFDFDSADHDGRSIERNADELLDRFVRACRRRAHCGGTPVVSLSGGLDSRSVLAGVAAAGIDCEAATMESEEYVPRSDVTVANRLAAALDVDWRTYRLRTPTGDDLDALLKTKNGLNPLGMGHILSFFEQLAADRGHDLTYLTGDGGDKVLPDLTPPKPLDDEAELAEYVVAEHGVFPLADVSSLTGISREDLLGMVRRRLRTYPESTPAGQYVHFLIRERAMNHLFEGEDRNRFYFWSATPFYALPVFTYAMNCPDDQKSTYRLYREFLRRLSPEVARIDRADYGVPPTSRRHALAVSVEQLLSRYPRLFERVKPVIKTVLGLETDSRLDQESRRCIRTQLERCEDIDEVLSRTATDEILNSNGTYDISQMYTLFTLTSYVEDTVASETTLSEFADRSFV